MTPQQLEDLLAKITPNYKSGSFDPAFKEHYDICGKILASFHALREERLELKASLLLIEIMVSDALSHGPEEGAHLLEHLCVILSTIRKRMKEMERSKPKMEAGTPCSRCKTPVMFVDGVEPYSPDHLQCPKCDSTFCMGQPREEGQSEEKTP